MTGKTPWQLIAVLALLAAGLAAGALAPGRYRPFIAAAFASSLAIKLRWRVH